MTIGYIIILIVFALAFVCLGIIGIKGEEKGLGILCFILSALFIIPVICGLVIYKNTDWKHVQTENIGEIEESKYVNQVDNQYVYGIKNPGKDTVELDIIYTDTEITVETEYLEEGESPYMQMWTRWQDYKEFTKYVFYIPKTE